MMHWAPYLLSGVLAVLVVACTVMLFRLRRLMMRTEEEHLRAMRALTSDRDEMEAALSSMVDAVLAVDSQRRLISLNDPAARLLDLRPDRHAGLPIDRCDVPEAVRELAVRSLALDGPIVEDVELLAADVTGTDPTPGPRLFQVTASPLRHRGVDQRIGSLIVLHDVTRLRRLEVIRRDFVTNASHEIRTPVAAIKMAAETLDDESAPVDPPTTRRFLKIIARQADRLQSLIDDLLSLARIERDTEDRRVSLKSQPILGVLRSAAEACQTAATPRGTRIEIDCPPDLAAPIHAPLLEQAVMNLLDNAVKYSPDHSLVRCSAERVNGEAVVSVIDRGVGIEPEHLPRVFERFYRTDKARSRELGGTGLGLSIVKHIAQVHAGRVSADSTPGRGSTFRLHLPAAQA
jgi:two-component system, OmpR family, phosphate regulon sensor histidine kinase PhoR